MGRAAFFAPENFTVPCRRLPPLTTIESNLALLWQGRRVRPSPPRCKGVVSSAPREDVAITPGEILLDRRSRESRGAKEGGCFRRLLES